MTVSLQYYLTPADYVAFYTFVFWEEGKKKRRLNYLKQAGFLLAFLAILYYAGTLARFNYITIIIFSIIFLSVILPLFTGKQSIASSAEKITENPQNANIFTEHAVEASDAALEIKTEFFCTKLNWSAIVKKRETPAYYFLYENALQAIIIPKRACKNEEEKLALSKVLARNISLDAEFNQTIS